MERLSFKEWQVLSDLEVLDSIPEDFEFSMARGELKTIKRSVDRIMKHLGGEGDLEAWVQSKITKANDYLNSVSNHMDGGEDDTKKEVKEGKSKCDCDCGKVPCVECGGDHHKNELKEEKCGDGMYYCKTSKKCKKIPKGYRVGKDGMLVKGVRWQDSDGDGKWYEPGDDVSEGSNPSFEVNKKKEVPEVPTQGPEVPKDMTFKTSELTKRIGKNIKKIKNDPNHPVNKLNKKRKLSEGAVEDLEKGMETLKSITYDSIDGLMKKIAEDHDISTTKLHYMFKAKHDMTPDDWAEKNLKEEMSNWRQDLDEKCWKGYEKKGMKTMFGKRYPNCVKKEEKDPFGRPGGKYGGVPKKGSGYDKAYQANMKKIKELEQKEETEVIREEGDNKVTPINKGKRMDAKKQAMKDMGKTPYDLNTSRRRAKGQGILDNLLGKPPTTEEVVLEKRDGKSAKSKGYSLRDWFKGGGWVQAGGKYDGKPCAKQPGQTTKPFCRDADDRAAMTKDEREKRAAKKRREDPNPERKGKAKIVTEGQGETAKPRTKNLQRPIGKQPKASYRDQMRAKQRQERLERQKSVDSSTQRGPTASKEAKKAEEKRKQNDPRASRLRGTIADRMAQGAREHGLGEAKIVTEGKEDKARRSELAKKHGLDMTKPGSRAKLARLMKADTISKKRKESGDVRTDKEVRKDNAANRKAIDATRQQLGQSKAKKGTERRRQVDKKLDNFRKELRSSDKPAEAPPTRQKVNVKVGTKVDKPADGPKTGRNKPTAEKRADRKSYEAQQRRNQKEDMKEGLVAEKKDACYHKVKSRYSVWPSAYASGALVKCRKVGAKNWGNKTKKEGYEFSDWRDDFKPTEIQSFDIVKAEPLVDVNSITEPVQLATEDYQRLQSTGNVFCIMLTWRGQPYKVQLFFPGGSRPSREEVKGEVDKLYPGAVISHYYPAPTDPTQPIVVIQR